MKRITTILFFLLCSLASHSQQVITLQPGKEPVSTGHFTEFFKDESGQLSFENVRTDKEFKLAESDIPNFNVTSDAIWGRIKFTCRQNADWYMQMDPATYNEILFYQKNKTGTWHELRYGNQYPASKWPLAVNHFVLPLDLQANDTVEIYFKIKDYYPIQLDMKAGTLESLVVPMHDLDLYNGICYGIMIMMLIYNLYLYVTQRQIAYLYYLLYVFFSMIFSSYLAGYGLHFPKFLLKLVQFAPIIPPAGFGIFGLLFTITLFKEVLSSKFKKVVYTFMFLTAADMVLSATPLVHWSENIIQAMGLVLCVLSITAAIKALKKKHTSAVFYLLGFGAYMFSLFYLILSAQSVVVANDFSWRALVTGSMIESIMLSFALGDKLKVSLREKQKAQEEAMLQLQENERLVREQNTILEEKVKERTHELEEKNKEILDSIHYARRIQYTLLAQASFLKQHLPEHFVLFKPKDIVSGDFYWATRSNELFFLSVCDSTGHGVPGAFMSLLNISFLNEAITEKKILDPGKALDHVRARLIENISQDGGKDGMDGILLNFDLSFTKGNGSARVHYAAANNAPLLIRNKEIIPLAKDKMPVGLGEKKEPFTLHTIELQKGDCLYLYTDGFGDQFGGPKGKKFKTQRLAESLQEISTEPIQKQKELLEEIFNTWKGTLEQIDDVCVIGVRI